MMKALIGKHFEEANTERLVSLVLPYPWYPLVLLHPSH